MLNCFFYWLSKRQSATRSCLQFEQETKRDAKFEVQEKKKCFNYFLVNRFNKQIIQIKDFGKVAYLLYPRLRYFKIDDPACI